MPKTIENIIHKWVDSTPILRETEEEMRLFEKFSDSYGYTFYVLQAA